jgi:hypothetical protein
MKYLHETPEGQLIDLSLKFKPIGPMRDSPLTKILRHLNVPFPNCWIRVRKRSNFLDKYFHRLNVPKGYIYKKPGDFDIIAGPLSDRLPTDYIIGIEVKRFKYIFKNNRWNLKKPYNLGQMQASGYTLYGFNKVMLHHFVVAEPVHLPGSKDGAVYLDNAGIVGDAMDAVKRLGIVPDGLYSYSITGWAQVPHKDKDPTHSGGIPEPYIVEQTPINPFANDRVFQNVRGALLDRIRQEIRQKHRSKKSLPLILSYKDLGSSRSLRAKPSSTQYPQSG